MPSLWDSLKGLDQHAKTLDEFRVRTKSGAAFSIVAVLSMFLLFCSEFYSYVRTTPVDHLVVDSSKGGVMKISFDITFPSMPCSVISMEAEDVSGEKQEGVMHHVHKHRLDKSGNEIGFKEKHELGGTLKTRKELNTKAAINATTSGDIKKCGSCYGAENDEIPCCNTCEQVREAYRKKGWAFSVLHDISQCSKEGFADSVKSQEGEGCNLEGWLQVPKVAGNVHFAPGKSFQHAHLVITNVLTFTMEKWNVSHSIKQLSFGDRYPGMTNPLDGKVKTLKKGTGMYQYYSKVVPTEYKYRSGKTVDSNQYSATQHFRPITSITSKGLPGLFIFYDISPIRVRIDEQSRSFSMFVTSLCAIVGGVFTVMQLLDQCTHRTFKSRSSMLSQ
jgi:endoplasmic reticulum-Golgi intermediate compartment protein 3|eukprot:Stramenopile-MAST_4_protein_2182